MKVLCACEESQRVCIAFREKGHEAYSCDIIECSGGHPEWHIQADVTDLLNGNVAFSTCDGVSHYIDKWGMIIAFPPCTHLAVSGARYFEEKRKNGKQKEAIEFFCKFLEAKAEKVVIENPIGIISGVYVLEHFPELAHAYCLPQKPTQIIQPWQYGDHYVKSTCLWIKGVKPLVPLFTEKPDDIEYKEWTDEYGRKKRQAQWYCDAWKLPPAERAKVRSKTFPGIAKAMAEQWG